MLLILGVYHPPVLLIAHNCQNDFPLRHFMGWQEILWHRFSFTPNNDRAVAQCAGNLIAVIEAPIYQRQPPTMNFTDFTYAANNFRRAAVWVSNLITLQRNINLTAIWNFDFITVPGNMNSSTLLSKTSFRSNAVYGINMMLAVIRLLPAMSACALSFIQAGCSVVKGDWSIVASSSGVSSVVYWRPLFFLAI